MSNGEEFKYPHEIITDQGETIVKVVPESKASKIHNCLFCQTETDFYEQHVLLLPRMFTGNRRYAHQECYEAHRRYTSSTISLHPKASNLRPNF